MATLPTRCPSCDSQLTIAKLRCACETLLEGNFEIPALLRLSPADLDFVLRFVKSSGSLKEMAKQDGQSYPTVRNRLNDIIRQLNDAQRSSTERRQSILDAIANGTLSVAEGEKKLREVH
jgi:hypothetical protein